MAAAGWCCMLASCSSALAAVQLMPGTLDAPPPKRSVLHRPACLELQHCAQVKLLSELACKADIHLLHPHRRLDTLHALCVDCDTDASCRARTQSD